MGLGSLGSALGFHAKKHRLPWPPGVSNFISVERHTSKKVDTGKRKDAGGENIRYNWCCWWKIRKRLPSRPLNTCGSIPGRVSILMCLNLNYGANGLVQMNLFVYAPLNQRSNSTVVRKRDNLWKPQRNKEEQCNTNCPKDKRGLRSLRTALPTPRHQF